MPQHIRLWSVDGDRLREIRQGRLDLESRLETWLREDISILGMDLLVISQQQRTAFGGCIDLLCIDPEGDLVIVELKRDRTPREITAQVLDYASWVIDLSAERVTEIANVYLGDNGPLADAFQRAFDTELPEVINEGHQMVVVGSGIDASSERIIRYLSDAHGLNINAVTFQFFNTERGDEVLGRAFLLEPVQVEEKAVTKGGSKRRRRRTREELETIATEKGAGDLYGAAVTAFEPLFNYMSATQSWLRFGARFDDKTGAVLNLVATAAGPSSLPFQIYSTRAARLFGRAVDEIVRALPPEPEPWEYQANADPWWSGHEGVFRSVQDVERLKAAFTSS